MASPLALAMCVVLTLAVYGRALGFSYFFDDAFDLTRTEAESFRSLLGAQPGYVYYRPLVFMLWKALFLLTGHYDRFLLHLIPIASHALAGWLFFLLLRRLTGSIWAILPMVLFLLFPFSYQAVEIIGTVFHPLVTAEILAALVLWYDGRVRASAWRLLAASVATVLALWTHEFGAAVFPLLAALEAFLWLQRRIGRPTFWLFAPLAAEALYLRIWFTLPKPNPEQVTPRDMALNGRFWLQGFAYPVSRQVNWLAAQLGANPAHLVGPLTLIAVLTGLGAYALARQLRLGLTSLAWGGIAFLPALETLTYGYIENGPRLLYVIAPGAAAFWGLLPMLRLGRRGITVAWRAATLGLAALALWQSVAFIGVRMDMLRQGTVMAQGIIQEGERHNGGTVLMLNVPSWFAAKTQEYSLGHFGVQLEPSYIGLSRLVYAGSLAHTDVESRSLAPDVSGWVYNFQPHGPPIDHNAVDQTLQAGAALAVVDLYHNRLQVREPGSILPDQPQPASRIATFDGLWLISARVSRQGDLVTVTTRWWVDAPLTADYQLWTQLRTAGGAVAVARKDYALRGMSPPRLWRRGDLVEDRLVLDVSTVTSKRPLIAWLSLVNTADGSLLPVQPEPGNLVRDGWIELGATPR